MDTITHYIGEAKFSSGGRLGDVFNPATGEVARKVALGGSAEVDAAVRAAAAAFPSWSATPPLTRARIMFKFRDLLERRADDIAALITAEHGKVLSDARGEATRGI